MCEERRGNPLPPEENVFRVLTHPSWWVEADERISSAAFNNPQFSGDVESMTTIEDSIGRHRNGSGLAKFNVGAAKALGIECLHFPEHGNDAHANVYNDGTDNKRKGKARKLAKLATAGLIRPPDLVALQRALDQRA